MQKDWTLTLQTSKSFHLFNLVLNLQYDKHPDIVFDHKERNWEIAEKEILGWKRFDPREKYQRVGDETQEAAGGSVDGWERVRRCWVDSRVDMNWQRDGWGRSRSREKGRGGWMNWSLSVLGLYIFKRKL